MSYYLEALMSAQMISFFILILLCIQDVDDLFSSEKSNSTSIQHLNHYTLYARRRTALHPAILDPQETLPPSHFKPTPASCTLLLGITVVEQNEASVCFWAGLMPKYDTKIKGRKAIIFYCFLVLCM